MRQSPLRQSRASPFRESEVVTSPAVTTQTSDPARPALTLLSEDERLFRDSVYEFADREIRPLVRDMDEHAKIPRALIDKLFSLGVMGIEIPESHGGAGASFFHSVLAVEALSRVDPSIGVLVDVQNTLVINALLRGATRTSGAGICRAWRPISSAPTRCRRPDRAATPSRWRRAPCRAATTGRSRDASSGSPTARKPTCSSCSRTRTPRRAIAASPRFSWSVASRASPSGRRKTSSASARAARASSSSKTAACPRANVLGEVGKGYKTAIETLNEGRIGIGAQMVGLTQGALDHAIQLHAGAEAVRETDRRVPGRAASARPRRHRPPHRSPLGV